MKLIKIIIIAFIFFSSTSFSQAKNIFDGTFETVFDIENWVENIEFRLEKLWPKIYPNEIVQKKYNQFRKINNKLIDTLQKKYKSWKIDYYTAKGIISHHKVFIYNTKMLFGYISLKIEDNNSSDLDPQIKETYSQMRISYNRMKFLYGKY